MTKADKKKGSHLVFEVASCFYIMGVIGNSRLLNCKLLALDYVDALGEGLLGGVDVGLGENQGALGVVNVNNGIGGLELLNACADVLETSDMLNFECVSSAGLSIPCEAAACGQECFVAIGTDQDAL